MSSEKQELLIMLSKIKTPCESKGFFGAKKLLFFLKICLSGITIVNVNDLKYKGVVS